MLKVLHLLIDQKFIDGAISLFESDSRTENSYYLIGDHKDACEFIKYKDVRYVSLDSVIDLCKQYQVVYLHSLVVLPYKYIVKIPKTVKVVWLAWGYDLYENECNYIIPIKVFMPSTTKYLASAQNRLSLAYNKLKRKIRLNGLISKALSRIDYFSGVFPYEYDEVCRYHANFKATPLDYYYGSTKFFIPEEPETQYYKKRNSIIIGNSGNPANNHIDVLERLRKVRMPDDVDIVLPLSYGGEKEYNSHVISLANQICGGRVNALDHFIPLNEYIDTISGCKVAIFGHSRQQASDNIFMQLIYGAKVYMSETSLAYHYLRSLGLKIFSIESELEKMWTDISSDEIMTNRTILSKLYSSSTLVGRIKKMNDTFLNDIR